MKHIESKMMKLSKQQMEYRNINSTLTLKLDELRNKIARAKQAASSVRSLVFINICSIKINHLENIFVKIV